MAKSTTSAIKLPRRSRVRIREPRAGGISIHVLPERLARLLRRIVFFICIELIFLYAAVRFHRHWIILLLMLLGAILAALVFIARSVASQYRAVLRVRERRLEITERFVGTRWERQEFSDAQIRDVAFHSRKHLGMELWLTTVEGAVHRRLQFLDPSAVVDVIDVAIRLRAALGLPSIRALRRANLASIHLPTAQAVIVPAAAPAVLTYEARGTRQEPLEEPAIEKNMQLRREPGKLVITIEQKLWGDAAATIELTADRLLFSQSDRDKEFPCDDVVAIWVVEAAKGKTVLEVATIGDKYRTHSVLSGPQLAHPSFKSAAWLLSDAMALPRANV